MDTGSFSAPHIKISSPTDRGDALCSILSDPDDRSFEGGPEEKEGMDNLRLNTCHSAPQVCSRLRFQIPQPISCYSRTVNQCCTSRKKPSKRALLVTSHLEPLLSMQGSLLAGHMTQPSTTRSTGGIQCSPERMQHKATGDEAKCRLR